MSTNIFIIIISLIGPGFIAGHVVNARDLQGVPIGGGYSLTAGSNKNNISNKLHNARKTNMPRTIKNMRVSSESWAVVQPTGIVGAQKEPEKLVPL